MGMAPRTLPKPNNSHIHHTLPVHRLLLEQEPTKGILAIMNNVKEGMPVSTMIKKSFTTMGLGLKNNCYEPCKAMTTATLTAMDQKQILVKPLPPPLLSDANNGPEAMMWAIDAWLDYQDYLDNKQALPKPHRSNMN